MNADERKTLRQLATHLAEVGGIPEYNPRHILAVLDDLDAAEQS